MAPAKGQDDREVRPPEGREQSLVESTISDAYGDDNIVTCNTVSIVTPSSSPKSLAGSGLVLQKKEHEEPYGSDYLFSEDKATQGSDPHSFGNELNVPGKRLCSPGNDPCVTEDVLTFGDDLFRKYSNKIDDWYPGQLAEKPEFLLQLRYWMLRSSPKERMGYDDLCEILSARKASSVKNLLAYWPLILRLHRVEQIDRAGGYDAKETIEACSESVAPKEFMERTKYQVEMILQRSFRETSPVRLGTYDPWFDAPGDRFALLAACSESGLTYSVDTVLVDPERLKQLREHARTHDFDALTFQHLYPQLADRLGFEKYDWNARKSRIRRGYKKLLRSRAQAEIWK